MKRTRFLILLCFQLLLMYTALFSQSSVWKVSGNGNTLFLAGTVHILREQDFPLPETYDQAYEQADMLVFETDIQAVESPEVMTRVMRSSIYGDDTTLQTMLSKNVYDSLKTAFDSAGMSIAMFSKMRVSMVVLTLTALKMEQMGFTNSGVDIYFYNKGKQDQKSFKFLESIDEQIHLLLHMGDGNENQFVRYSLRDMENMESEFMEMISAWRKGSGQMAKKFIAEMKKDYPNLYKDLLVNRNLKWLKALNNFLETDEVEMVLVGDLHLYGEEGLLKSLQQAGYKTDQVPIPDK